MASEQYSHERIEAIKRQNREYTLFSWSVQNKVDPIVVTGGKGVRFWDASGKVYLDFSSQLINSNIGHQHPKVIQAIHEQAEKLCFAAPSFATEVRGELGRLLAEVSPGNLKKSFLTLGGAEANDNAIKIARFYTGRHKIISRYRSYHGATYGAMTLSGDFRRLPIEPGIPGVVRVFDPYCYRCSFHQEPSTCHLECVSSIEEVINYEGPDKIAAVIIEGITGTNGIHVPPPTYVPALRQLCDKYDILLIADEVMSGWGRTGEWFSVNHWNVVPDIITTAKGITSGYVPLGAVIMSDKIGDFFEDKMLWAGLTYNAHTLSCAAAVACINVYKEDRLIENSREMGQVLAGELARMKERHPSVGDVRSIGLFSCIELVKDRQTREPLVTAKDQSLIGNINKFLLENGVLVVTRLNTIVVAPPLCINRDELLEGLAKVDEALDLADRAL